MSAQSYIFRVAIFTLLAVFLVLGWNFVVDPYAITGVPRIAHFNQYKVDINNYTRLSKKYQPGFGQYSTLVVGNSRVEMGINPAHRCFVGKNWKVYNLGIPGAGIRTQLTSALNLIYQQPVERVFLSLDFTDFIYTNPHLGVERPGLTQQTSGDLPYLASGQPNPDFLRVAFMDYYKALFSLDALIGSFKTVVSQSHAAPDRDEAGFNPARDMAHAVEVEGPWALFEQKMLTLKPKYSRRWYLRDTNGELGQTFDDVAEFLKVAASRDVEVHLFTNPFHDSYWQLLETQGLMPLYADWVQSIEGLVRENESAGVALWDFSQDSPYIHEAVPVAGVRTGPLQWFWEPAHYRKELGDLMVAVMLSDSCETDVVFGRKVL